MTDLDATDARNESLGKLVVMRALPQVQLSPRFKQVGVVVAAALLAAALIFQLVAFSALDASTGDIDGFMSACLLAPLNMGAFAIPSYVAMQLVASFADKWRFRSSSWFRRSLGFTIAAAIFTAFAFVAEEGSASETGGLAFIFAPIVGVASLVYLGPPVSAVVGLFMLMTEGPNDTRSPTQPNQSA